jgi:hypothetical protein
MNGPADDRGHHQPQDKRLRLRVGVELHDFRLRDAL